MKDIPLRELGLSYRSYACLVAEGKNTLEDVANMTEAELWEIKHIGKKSVKEIKEALAKHGMELKEAE